MGGSPPARRGQRLDGLEKVTGAATYAADISRPGMLWAKVLRSPLPHARIVTIDASRAKVLPGVHAVLTAADLPDCRLGRSTRDMPILARDKVRFVGEKVAAVAAESRELAEEALGLIEVEYDELPVVFDPVEAMQPGAPYIHEPDEVRARATPKQVVPEYPNGVSAPRWGASLEEVERALAAAPRVFEHTFRMLPQHQAYLEPHACLVEFDERGVAHLWASNKAPFLLFNYLREGMGLEREQLEFHMLPLGGDFGGKGSFMDIPLAYLLARQSGRPVKLAMTYPEELQAGNPRHAAVVTMRSGFDAEGRLLAHLTRAVYASGGYAAFKPAPDATLPGIFAGGRGSYEVPVWRVEGHMVYTNTVPGGHMRSPGEAQPLHAWECHVDLCARALGIDPLELRLRNAPGGVGEASARAGTSAGFGQGEHGMRPTGRPGVPRAREVLRAAAEAIGWGTAKEEGVGRGIALVEIANSLGIYSARMLVERDGQVVLHTPMMENGAGMLTAFRRLIADEFGLPLESVRVEQTLEGIEFDRGIGGSRITRIVGRIIGLLSERLRTRLAEQLAAELGCSTGEVRFEAGGFRDPSGRLHSLAEVAGLIEPGPAVPSGVALVEQVRYEPEPADAVGVFAAQAAEVHVARETGQVRVRRVVSVHEVGRIVEPTLHQGQIEGALVQGLGYALTEGLVVQDGRVTNVNLHEYKLPCMLDLPPLETILLPPDLSLGITPIGEGANCGISACVVNAVVDAVSGMKDKVVDIPIDPEQLREVRG